MVFDHNLLSLPITLCADGQRKIAYQLRALYPLTGNLVASALHYILWHTVERFKTSLATLHNTLAYSPSDIALGHIFMLGGTRVGWRSACSHALGRTVGNELKA